MSWRGSAVLGWKSEGRWSELGEAAAFEGHGNVASGAEGRVVVGVVVGLGQSGSG